MGAAVGGLVGAAVAGTVVAVVAGVVAGLADVVGAGADEVELAAAAGCVPVLAARGPALEPHAASTSEPAKKQATSGAVVRFTDSRLARSGSGAGGRPRTVPGCRVSQSNDDPPRPAPRRVS